MDFLSGKLIDDVDISISSTIIAIFLSGLSSYIIRLIYLKYGKSMNNRDYFAGIFVLLTVTTCVVIVVVKYSLALSLGLVGALSIVRFRAAIKEPEELVYLFICIALGIAYGSNQFVIGLLFLASIILIVIIYNFFNSKKIINTDITQKVLIFEGKREAISSFSEKLKNLKSSNEVEIILKEITLDGDTSRITAIISQNEDEIGLIKTLDNLSNKSNLTMSFVSDVSIAS